MNISGSGKIAAGDYNESIKVSGSGRLEGNIRCVALSCSGSVKGDGSVDCTEDVRVSGSCHIEENLIAKNISASGAIKIGGNMKAAETVKISGSLNCGGSVKGANISCSGSVVVGGEMSAEEIGISGRINCEGLMNAEKIEIDMSGASVTSAVGSMGGSEIKVLNSKGGKAISRMPLLKHIVGGSGSLTVKELIEGDVVALEYTTVPKVVGRIVAIGDGCEIDLVQYSEEIEIHPKAKVEKYEKI